MPLINFARSRTFLVVASMVSLRLFSASGAGSAADIISDAIKHNRVVVFSKSYCPYCARTKQVFADLNIPIKLFELDQLENGDEIQHALLGMTKQRTVPNVFVNGHHIGGNDDTQKALKTGKLAQLLEIKDL